MWPFRNKDKHPEKNNGELLVQKLNLNLSQTEKVRQMIRHELFRQAIGKVDKESFDEANDFDLEDEEWVSPYEETYEPDPSTAVTASSPEPVSGPGAAPEPVKPSAENVPPQQTPSAAA